MALLEKNVLDPREYNRLGFNTHFCAGCSYLSPVNDLEKVTYCIKCLEEQDRYFKEGNPVHITKDDTGRRKLKLI